MDKPSAIVVKLPETFDTKGARRLRRDLKSKLGADSPAVLVDLSRLKSIDLAGVQALLECLEEIAKRDGALQVTAMSPEAATIVELTRMDHLFEKFPGFSVEAPVVSIFPEAVEAPVVELSPEPVAETPVQLPAVA
jgi:anti-sigma B factor antagonist